MECDVSSERDEMLLIGGNIHLLYQYSGSLLTAQSVADLGTD